MAKRRPNLTDRKWAASHCCCRIIFFFVFCVLPIASLFIERNASDAIRINDAENIYFRWRTTEPGERKPRANIVCCIHPMDQLECAPVKRTLWFTIYQHNTTATQAHTHTHSQKKQTFSTRTKLRIEKAFRAKRCLCVCSLAVAFVCFCMTLLIKTRLKLISCNMKHIFSIPIVPGFGCGALRSAHMPNSVSSIASLVEIMSFFTFLAVALCIHGLPNGVLWQMATATVAATGYSKPSVAASVFNYSSYFPSERNFLSSRSYLLFVEKLISLSLSFAIPSRLSAIRRNASSFGKKFRRKRFV